ncbi:MAG TPA: tetratricopeptide repeat protein [Ktedonobacterales bacterium]
MSLALGSVLAGRYRILARLGEGGMGSVYRAEDLRLAGRMWAIKELLADSTTPPDEMAAAIKRFDAEIDLMARLANPRIPAVADRFHDGNRHYFVMDFVPGASLEERLTRAHGPLPERDVLGWLIQVCEVLAYIHGQHPPIILRDLKPANIMVTPEGEVRVIDFGIARTYKFGRHTNTENLGTLLYASPEHVGQQAQTDARSDIYSVGATLYHLLTNHEPTPMETPAPGALRRHNPRVSAATDAVVRRAMQVDPALRYQTATQLGAALRQSLAALDAPSAAPATRAAPTRAASPRQTAARPAVPRLARPRGGIVCAQCGHLNRTGARFCARDGVPLPGAGAVAAAATAARRSTGRSAPSPALAPVANLPTPAASGTARRPIVTVPVTAGTAELNAQRGAQAFASGRYPVAARHLEAAAAQGRATYDVLMLLGRTYRRMGRPKDASAQFEHAGRLRPAAEAYYEQGLAEREAGRAAQAQVALLRARQLDPHDPLIAHQLGLACLEQGLLTQAEGELQEGLTLRADHPGILAALGRVRAAQHQWAEAAEYCRRAVAANPADAGAHLDLGRALLALRRLTEATRAIEESARLAPGSAEAQIALGMCYHAQGKRRPAKNALERALALEPNDPEAQRLLKQI